MGFYSFRCKPLCAIKNCFSVRINMLRRYSVAVIRDSYSVAGVDEFLLTYFPAQF